MGSTTMPEFKRVPLEVAQNEPRNNRFGYSYKAFEEILAAHKEGQGLEIAFVSVTSSNKMVGHIAYHAEEVGFKVFTRRTPKSPVRYFWLEPIEKETTAAE